MSKAMDIYWTKDLQEWQKCTSQNRLQSPMPTVPHQFQQHTVETPNNDHFMSRNVLGLSLNYETDSFPVPSKI